MTANTRRGSGRAMLSILSIALLNIFVAAAELSAKPAAAVRESPKDSFKVLEIRNWDQIHSLNARDSTWWIRADGIRARVRNQLPWPANPRGAGWHPVRVPSVPRAIPSARKARDLLYGKALILPAADHDPIIEIGQISDRDRVYFNGKLIGSTGRWNSPRAQALDKPRVYRIAREFIRPGAVNVLLVHTRRYHDYHYGIHRGSVRMGPARAMLFSFYAANFGKLMLLAFYLAVGGYFLFLFAHRRGEIENLYLGLFIVFLILALALRNPLKYELGWSLTHLKLLENIGLFLFPPMLWGYVRSLFPAPAGLFGRGENYLFKATLLIALLSVTALAIHRDAAFYYALFFDFYLYVLIGGVSAVFALLLFNFVKRKRRDALYILLGFIAFMTCAALDAMRARGLIVLPELIDFGQFVLVMGLASVLARRYVRTMRRVELLNRDLESRVRERTRRLDKSLRKVKRLKHRQDGDYYLTSLLLQPLAGNLAHSEFVEVAFQAIQHKKFKFRGNGYEIGGDINIADGIRLRGREYTVFVNADAMGKSIQGAGGALVLGTVINSLLARTKLTTEASERRPEQWLKSCVLELQNAFAAFSGSMFASTVIGLVDDANGLLYYVNAEHPWMVLYRRGRARFVEKQITRGKFGMPAENELTISTLRLLPGDVLFAGSDGRDDILIGLDDGGGRLLNQDEFIFPRIIEKVNGAIHRIPEELKLIGRLTDDLSIVRVAYCEGRSAIAADRRTRDLRRSLVRNGRIASSRGHLDRAMRYLEQALSIRGAARSAGPRLLRLYLKSGEFNKAHSLSRDLAENEPADPRFLYYASVACKSVNRLDEAADYGECCRLRAPDMTHNLVNLADVYRRLGDAVRAQALLGNALAMAPDHSGALRLKEMLSERVRAETRGASAEKT